MDILEAYEYTFKLLPEHRRELYRDLTVTRPAKHDETASHLVQLVIYTDYPKQRLATQAVISRMMYMNSNMPPGGLVRYFLREVCHKMALELERLVDDRP